MKTKILFFVVAFVFSIATAQAEPVETLATQAILVDADTGTILLDKGADIKMPTSSMSKVMTMYMVFEALKLGKISMDDKFSVSLHARGMDGSRMFLDIKDTPKVEDLIRGVVIQSGNDASVVLAEGIAGSEQQFADAMNIRAKEIGLTNSHFVNATGWPDPEHYSTPRDLAVLAFRIMMDFPEYYHYFSEKEFTYNKIRQHNRDPLLGRLSGADGLKTGHTDIAGFGLIGSAKRGDRRIIMVLNGLTSLESRGDEGVRVMEWGFKNFERKKIVSAGETIESADVWLGITPLLPMVAEKDVVVVLPTSRRNEMKLVASYLGPLKAPLKKGAEVGKLRIEIPDQLPIEIKLQAGMDIERKGVFGRAKDRFSYLLTGAY